MVTESELRIGNWYLGYDNKPFQLSLKELAWMAADIAVDEIIKSGIPLTHDLLESYGFIKVKNKENIYQTVGGKFQILFREKGNSLFYIQYDEFMGYCYINGILFDLHQLQNLYFGIEFEELKTLTHA